MCAVFFILPVVHLRVCSGSIMPRVAKKTIDIGHEMEYMLATGNLRSRSGLGLQQVTCRVTILPYIFSEQVKTCMHFADNCLKSLEVCNNYNRESLY